MELKIAELFLYLDSIASLEIKKEEDAKFQCAMHHTQEHIVVNISYMKLKWDFTDHIQSLYIELV